MNQFINEPYKNLIDLASTNAERYKSNVPFPNISFDNFFSEKVLDSVLNEFSDLSKEKEIRQFDNLKEKKLAKNKEEAFGLETRRFIHYLNSAPFLQFLQILTGIKEPLIGDPYLAGGGMHEIKKDGFLKIHADFNKHPELKLDRRINVLVYLNKDWKDEYGGHFELWDKSMTKCEKKIAPIFNKIAIFSTTDYSYHGHPDPLTCPENRSRKSLALYYYSNGRPAEEINKNIESHGTLFVPRKNNMDDKAAFKSDKTWKTMIRNVLPSSVIKILKGK